MRASHIIALLAVSLTLVLTHGAEGAPLVVSFEEPGQLCLSRASEKRLVEQMRVLPAGELRVTIRPMSDQLSMRLPDWRGNAPCAFWPIPDVLTGHARLATIRGFAVAAAAMRARIPAFFRPPVVEFNDDSNLKGEGVIIRPQQAPGIGAAARIVEIDWHPVRLESAVQAEHRLPPFSAAVATQGELVRRYRTSGLLSLIGGAPLALAGAGMLIGAHYKELSAQLTLTAVQRDEFNGQARILWVSGGIVLGVGAALAAIGAGLLFLEHQERQRAAHHPKPMATQAVSWRLGFDGLALRF